MLTVCAYLMPAAYVPRDRIRLTHISLHVGAFSFMARSGSNQWIKLSSDMRPGLDLCFPMQTALNAQSCTFFFRNFHSIYEY